MKEMVQSGDYQYRAGGTLPYNAAPYVEREADGLLYDALKAGDFCYIFHSRQQGKSSLQVRVRQRLETDGFACAFLDVSAIGTQGVTADTWYPTLIQTIVQALDLSLDVPSWWSKQDGLTHLSRLMDFFTNILLKQKEDNILIVVDEIDSVLSLDFPTDDFFAFIRSCFNQRGSNPDYERLTFLLLGVATPSNLIADKVRTPFNLGKAIELSGFQLAEVQPLMHGLKDIVEQPSIVLKEILDWTDGQPFLTQKICKFIFENKIEIKAGEEKEIVSRAIEESIISNWEIQDNPEHLRTIQDRIRRNEKQARRWLDLYIKILRDKGISLDNSPDQNELILSGLIIKKEGYARISNKIYEKVFNADWLRKILDTLKPYSEVMNAWKDSDYQDDSRLLRGQALRDALSWSEGKELPLLDQNFLKRSQEFVRDNFIKKAQDFNESNQLNLDTWIKRSEKNIIKFTPDINLLVSSIKEFTGNNLPLFKFIINQLAQSQSKILSQEDAKKIISKIIYIKIFQPWKRFVEIKEKNGKPTEKNDIPPAIRFTFDQVCKASNKNKILIIYKQVLDNIPLQLDDRPELVDLLKIGLVKLEKEQLKVANKIYRECFNLNWTEHQITKVDHGLKIKDQYLILAELSKEAWITRYQVRDEYHPELKEFIAIKFSPKNYIEHKDKNTSNKIKDEFFLAIQKLGKIYHLKSMPEIISTFENQDEYFLIQELVEGKNLGDLISNSTTWDQSDIIDFLLEVLKVLDAMHRAGINHLNLHPNCFKRRASDRKLALTDFAVFQNIAAMVIENNVDGSSIHTGVEGYAAPEQKQGEAMFSSDIYAVGMMAVQTFTGLHPSQLPEDPKTKNKIWQYTTTDAEQNLSDIDGRLIKLIGKMIAYDHSERYADVKTVLVHLSSLKNTLMEELNQRKQEEQDSLSRKVKERTERDKSQKEKEQKKRENAENQRKRKIKRNILISAITIAAIASAALGYGKYNYKECKKPLSSTEESLAGSALATLATQVKQHCDFSIKIQIFSEFKSVSLFHRGLASLALWYQEEKLNNQDKSLREITDAIADFNLAKEKNGRAFVDLALASTIIQNGNFQQQQREYYPDAIQFYLEQSAKLNKEDIPRLVKLAFFQINEDRSNPEYLEQGNQLLEKALSVNKDQNLKYNQAVLNARANGEPKAIALLKDIVSSSNAESNSELIDKAHQSLGFIYLQLGLKDRSNFDAALTELSAVGARVEIVDQYKATLEQCIQTRDCDRAEIVEQLANEDLNEVFPIVPVYKCTENPALAIAEQALIDRGLEPESTKLCR